jgi:hypothetical protein
MIYDELFEDAKRYTPIEDYDGVFEEGNGVRDG